MLVLSRKVEESIMIGNDIEVKITSIGRDTVRIGIKAPKSVPIWRKEILEREARVVAQENQPKHL